MNIIDAINESSQRRQITSATFEGDESDLISHLDALVCCEFDTAVENDGSIDVWGFDIDAPEWSMNWRIRVKLEEPCE